MTSSSARSASVELPRSAATSRATFLARTYQHLFGAILAFTALEVWLFRTGLADRIAQRMLAVNWLLVLGAFMIVSWFASRAAHRATAPATQYGALALFVVAESVFFVPLLYLADRYAPGTIQSAAILTLLGFSGLTAITVWTRADFSFLGELLRWSFIVALLLIVGAYLYGFGLGTWFSIAMIAVAGAAILYDTSRTLLHFQTDRHVAAALQLFASVALMFWYVLRLVRARS